MKRILIGTFVMAMAAGLVGCTPLNQDDTPAEPNLSFTALATNDAIPASYGKLVSVTTDEAFPGWSQLWFAKEDGTITTVFVKYINGTLRQKALVIPRS